MGISLDQYRAAIGSWAAGRIRKLLPAPEPTELYEPKEPDSKRNLSGPWKLHAATLLLVLLMVVCQGICIAQPGPLMDSSSNMVSPCTRMSVPDEECRHGNMISSNCLSALLMISGVESNPGPEEYTLSDDDKQKILTSLIVNTDDISVKGVLKTYDVSMTTKDLKRKLNAHDKDKLVNTMSYLGVYDQADYTKPTVVHNLVCRIQSLFPDTCIICDSVYATDLHSTPLIECAYCGQGAHTECIMQLSGIDNLADISIEDRSRLINPHNIPGVHYFCGECATSIVPSRESGKLKRARTSTLTADDQDADRVPAVQATPAAVSDSSDQLHTAGSTSTDPDEVFSHTPVNQDVESNSNSTTDSDVISGGTAKADAKTSKSVKQKQDKPVCRFFRQGTCKHGISGKGCPNQHPKACPRLIRHGNQSAKGCNKGNTCKDFHPKMCPQSLTARECLTLDCPLRHVAGTKRTTSKTNRSAPKNRATNEEHHKVDDFLDAALKAMETRLMDALDIRLKSLQLSTTAPAATLSTAHWPTVQVAQQVPLMDLSKQMTNQVPLPQMTQSHQNQYMTHMPHQSGALYKVPHMMMY